MHACAATPKQRAPGKSSHPVPSSQPPPSPSLSPLRTLMLVRVGSPEGAGGSRVGHDLQHSEFDLIYFPLAAAKEGNSPNAGRAGQVTSAR